MSEEMSTRPTWETVLERMVGMEERINARIDERLSKLEERLSVRLDRIESEVKQTHSELYALRADFTELRGALKEQMPTLQ